MFDLEERKIIVLEWLKATSRNGKEICGGGSCIRIGASA